MLAALVSSVLAIVQQIVDVQEHLEDIGEGIEDGVDMVDDLLEPIEDLFDRSPKRMRRRLGDLHRRTTLAVDEGRDNKARRLRERSRRLAARIDTVEARQAR